MGRCLIQGGVPAVGQFWWLVGRGSTDVEQPADGRGADGDLNRSVAVAETVGRRLFDYRLPSRGRPPSVTPSGPAGRPVSEGSAFVAGRREELRRERSGRSSSGPRPSQRHEITVDQAFRLLAEASRRTNRKLRDLAENLELTGELWPARPGVEQVPADA
ncbi:ANTAR domain-containing protein [Modestobacter caceresii]|uniref:ANTAR domain-containing protein n=1 Tax=Modestobacter caceresii TaxID=1522368 RepID=UPI0009DEB0FC